MSDFAHWTSTDVYGLETLTLPEGCTPLEAVCVVKVIDREGRVCIVSRSTRTLPLWEMMGMLTAMSDACRQGLADAWGPASQPEGEPGPDELGS